MWASKVVWEMVSCDNISIEMLASNFFQAMADLTHLLPQMDNISNIFSATSSGQNFLQNFVDPVHVFQAIRNVTNNFNIQENVVNIFQATQNVTTTFLEMANLTQIFSGSGNSDNSFESVISGLSQTLQEQNMTMIIESIGIGANFVLTEGVNFLQGEGNLADIGALAETVPSIIDSVLGNLGNIFPNVFGKKKLPHKWQKQNVQNLQTLWLKIQAAQ